MPVHNKNTTWNDYINDALLHSGHISKAGIYGLNNGEEWASSPGLQLPPDLIRVFVGCFIDPAPISKNGIPIGDVTYVCVKTDDRLIMGRRFKKGCILARCTNCVIVALYDDIVNGAKCEQLVGRLADYFVDHNV